MKIRKSVLTTAAGLLLAVFGGMSLASAAPQKQSSAAVKKEVPSKSKAKSVTGVSVGTIASIDAERLVLSNKKKDGKVEERTFLMSPTTERKGELKTGEKVSIHYKTENKQMLATAVQAAPQKTAAAAKKPGIKK